VGLTLADKTKRPRGEVQREKKIEREGGKNSPKVLRINTMTALWMKKRAVKRDKSGGRVEGRRDRRMKQDGSGISSGGTEVG